jgi:hypothetical protein
LVNVLAGIAARDCVLFEGPTDRSQSTPGEASKSQTSVSKAASTADSGGVPWTTSLFLEERSCACVSPTPLLQSGLHVVLGHYCFRSTLRADVNTVIPTRSTGARHTFSLAESGARLPPVVRCGTSSQPVLFGLGMVGGKGRGSRSDEWHCSKCE